MSLQACADIVRAGDPDRFAAAMAAPVAARRVLFPIYAFNVEVARAPFVTEEPLIAEMRLQWWRDALDEIAGGGTVRRHEVVTPLAEVLRPDLAPKLLPAIDARRWDIGREPFATDAELWSHLDQTAGTLMQVSAEALGGAGDTSALARGAGMAAWFIAVPKYFGLNRRPLPVPDPDAVHALAEQAIEHLHQPHRLTGAAKAAALAAWPARDTLREAIKRPSAVLDGSLAVSEFRRRLALVKLSLFGT
ncbi:MAG: squalene/phytoene synthase family protein [Pseudomonadota bacterium]